MSIDAARIFEAITEYVEAAADAAVANAEEDSSGYRGTGYGEKKHRNMAAEKLRQVLREELDP